MKIAIIADIHANYDAWKAFPESYDELWVVGDIVNYGPEPKEVLSEVRDQATIIVRGNHDHAVGHDDDTGWSPHFRKVAEATRRFTSTTLSITEKAWLGGLPLYADVERAGVRFHLTHAAPSDRLYGHIPENSDAWLSELEGLSADVLIVGHSHEQFIRKVGRQTILNPGSLGQSRGSDGSVAQYAIWYDGGFYLKEYHYPVEETIRKIKNRRYSYDVEIELLKFLERKHA